MAIVETIKAAANTALEVLKANPVAAGVAVVGVAVVGYGGYRGVRYLRNRPVAAATETAASAASAAIGAVAANLQEVVVDPVKALLSLTRAEAEELGVLAEWNVQLKTALRAKQAK